MNHARQFALDAVLLALNLHDRQDAELEGDVGRRTKCAAGDMERELYDLPGEMYRCANQRQRRQPWLAD
jgi:hypothetical protein